LTVTGSAVASPVTEHLTRSGAPPLLADMLHWSTVALVVLATGAHIVVGPVGETPPWPEPMHWLTVTPEVGVPTGMLLMIVTSQVTLLPPP
jgi:hypothetical protein